MENLYSTATGEHNLLLILLTHSAKSWYCFLFHEHRVWVCDNQYLCRPEGWHSSSAINTHTGVCTTCPPAEQVSFPCPAVTRAVQGSAKRVSHKLIGQLYSDGIKSCLLSVKEGWDLKNHLISVQPFLPTYSRGAGDAHQSVLQGWDQDSSSFPSGSLLQFQNPLPAAARRYSAVVLLLLIPNKIWTFEFKALWSRIF